MERMKIEEILDHLQQLFPDAHCELNHRNAYELSVAVILSAQTTDVSVNKVTPALFKQFPTPEKLASASLKEVEACISSLGLYRNKARMIVGFAKGLMERFNGVVPERIEELVTLDGIGRKCANVILGECYGIPSLAVDTHVARISKRLGLCYQKDDVYTIEKKLKRKIPKDRWIKTHHQMIFFGRYRCQARTPKCMGCPFVAICHEKQKHLDVAP